MDAEQTRLFSTLFSQIKSVVIGCEDATLLLTCSLLAQGHALIEDVPGVGKTLLAQSMAKSTSLSFSRVQCTPDVLPSDILGFSLYDVHSGESRFIPGAVMTNLLLVDEINRASPKTQSALLEAMEERQSTVDGVTRMLPNPFMVIATQNPVESVGTSPLPEAQLDRFMMRLSLGYPTAEQELALLYRFKGGNAGEINPVFNGETLVAMQNQALQVAVEEPVRRYIVSLVRATREHRDVALGVSPRGALALMHCSQAMAFICGQAYVTPDIVRSLAPSVLAHRLILHAAPQGKATEAQNDIIDSILSDTYVPVK